MNRYRKKYQQSDDDQVSIFDSEEDQPRKHKNKVQEKKQKKDQNEVKKRIRAPSQKAIEKKLSKFEKDIMKDLIDKDEENKTIEPTTTTHHEESDDKKDPNTQIKEEDTIVLPSSAPVKNNLDEEQFKIEQEDLTWFDLQEVKAKQQYIPYLETTALQAPKKGTVGNSLSSSKAPLQQKTPALKFTTNNQHYNQPIEQIYNYNQQGYPPYSNQNKPNKQKRSISSYQSSGYQPIYSPYVGSSYGINQGIYNGYYGNTLYGQYDNRSYPHPYYPFQTANHYSPTIQENQDYDPELLDSAQLQETMMDDKNLEHQQNLPLSQEDNSRHKKITEQQPKQQMSPQELKEYKKNRKIKLLEEIQKLKTEFKYLEDQTEKDLEQQPTDDDKGEIISKAQKLYQQWKFDPNITELPETSYKKVESTFEAQQKFQKSKTEGRMVMIEQVLSENPFLTQFQMAEVLRARDPGMNAKIQRSVVLRLLKMGGYKKKKILLFSKDRNSQRNIDLRCEFAHIYQRYAGQKFNIFYYDELILNQYFEKESGWCKEDDQIQFKPAKFISRSVVILALLAQDGTCRWDVRFGNYSKRDYCSAMSQMLKYVGKGLDKKLLIANPVAYRSPKHISEIAKRRNWQLLVLPPQGIYLNPLQAYFFELKEILKRRKFDNLEKLFEQTVAILRECDKNQLGKKTIVREFENIINRSYLFGELASKWVWPVSFFSLPGIRWQSGKGVAIFPEGRLAQ